MSIVLISEYLSSCLGVVLCCVVLCSCLGGASKTNFWSKLGFCPNRLTPPPRTLVLPKEETKLCLFGILVIGDFYVIFGDFQYHFW